MYTLRNLLCLTLAATACAGDPGPSDPGDDLAGPTFAVGTVAPGATPQGEAVLNLHYFPMQGDARARLHIDGVPAVWGAGASTGVYVEPPPVDGDPIEVGIGRGVPPIGIATGTRTLELVVDGDVVASETVDLQALTVYSLVAYGDPAAPQQLFFTDPIPGTGGTTVDFYAPRPVTIYNMMPGGPAIYGSKITMHGSARDRIFEGLAYGQAWEGTFLWNEFFHIEDQPQPDEWLGGFGFTGDHAGRFYIMFREPNTGDLAGAGDSWFIR